MKHKWPYLIILFLGFLLTGNQLLKWYHTTASDYTTPKFEELKVSQGTLSFTPSWKNSGGQIILDLASGKRIVMTCLPPFGEGDRCFFRADKSSTDYSHQLTGKHVTAWWKEISDTPRPQITGRIYQLEVDGWLYYDYKERAEYYLKHLHLGEEDNLFFAAFYFFIGIFLPIRKYFKEN